MSFWRSHRRLRAALSLLLLLAHIGCTSWRTQPVAPAAFVEERQPQTVRLTLQDGSKVVLHSPMMRGDTVVGLRQASSQDGRSQGGSSAYGQPSEDSTRARPESSEPSDTVTVPLHEVQTIAVQKGDVGKSIGLVFAVVGAMALVSIAACAATDCFDYNWGSYGNDSAGSDDY